MKKWKSLLARGLSAVAVLTLAAPILIAQGTLPAPTFQATWNNFGKLFLRTDSAWQSIQWYGATGDGIVNEVAALRAAYAAAPSGGSILIPCGTHNFTSSDAEVLLITKPINIVTPGKCAVLTGTLSASTDLFHPFVGNGGFFRGLSFSGMDIQTTGGASIFHFDSSTSGAIGFAEVGINHVYVENQPGLHSIFIDNNAANSNGGTFNTYFQKNYLTSSASHGAIWVNYGGDSIRSEDNILTGAGYGWYVNQIAGAGQFISIGDNITACLGVRVDGGTKPSFSNFEIEMISGCANVTGAVINFAGSVGGGIDGGTIGPGQVQSLNGSTGTVENINIGVASNVLINGVRNATTIVSSPPIGINVGASSTSTVIGCNNNFSGFSLNIQNLSASTQSCIPLTWTPRLAGSTTAGTPTYTINIGRYSVIGGNVSAQFTLQATSLGTAAGNLLITNLPFAPVVDDGGCVITRYSVAGLAASNFGLTASIAATATQASLLSNGAAGTNAVTVAQAGSTPILVGLCNYHL